MRILAVLLIAALLFGCMAQSGNNAPPAVKPNVTPGVPSNNGSMNNSGNGTMNNSDMLAANGTYKVTAAGVKYFGDTQGYLAKPEKPGSYPGVVMIHEWWGLNDNIKDMARQLASRGYVVLAVDLYDGKVATTPDQAMALVGSLNQSRATENMKAAAAYLRSNEKASRLASLGWCFGGGESLQLSLSGEKMDATVIYYGNVNVSEAQLSAIKWPVLGIFGENDTAIPVATARDFDSKLGSLGVTNEIYIYPGVGHAFANPSGMNYAPEETKDAWNKTLTFLDKYMKGGAPDPPPVPPVNTTPPPVTPPQNQTPPPPPQPSVKEFTIEADDSGFYPSGPLEVGKGDTVKITFKVRSSNVYYGGLQFKSAAFSTGKVSPGGSTGVEFTADDDMTITSYWGTSLVKKADLQVSVSD
ncbi:MAG TPA: dienelactone hydrolase family protein [Candidatus Bilamarchaeum sp.]|nr:dienelactone hydrolase family protein [Candidatus Bilamarchaeum sp.]